MTRGEKIGALLVVGWLAWRTRPKATPATPRPTTATSSPPKPTPVARIYTKPGVDMYDAVHMSVETPGMPPTEMGAFANRAAAEDVAKGYGWKVLP